MLQAERELRLSSRVQALFAEAELDDTRDWIRVVKEVVDPEICKRFNITPFVKHRILSW